MKTMCVHEHTDVLALTLIFSPVIFIAIFILAYQFREKFITAYTVVCKVVQFICQNCKVLNAKRTVTELLTIKPLWILAMNKG